MVVLRVAGYRHTGDPSPIVGAVGYGAPPAFVAARAAASLSGSPSSESRLSPPEAVALCAAGVVLSPLGKGWAQSPAAVQETNEVRG